MPGVAGIREVNLESIKIFKQSGIVTGIVLERRGGGVTLGELSF
jgi:hypothetical protein